MFLKSIRGGRRPVVNQLVFAVAIVALATPLWHPAVYGLRAWQRRRRYRRYRSYTFIDWLDAVGTGTFVGGLLLGLSHYVLR